MTAFSVSKPTPTSIQIKRTFDAPVALVWRAHTEPELVKQWMTGAPGTTLSVCEIDFRVGGKARYVWKNPDFEMGMTAEFLEIVEHERIVYTETYESWPDGDATVTASFVEQDGKTNLTVYIEYPTETARDSSMQMGYAAGFEASYATLDGVLRELGERP